MIDAEEDSPLRQVHQQRDQIVAALQELRVLALMEIVNSDVDLRTAGHPARQFLAQEKAGAPPESFRALDFIVIRQGVEAHAAALKKFIHRFRIAVTLAANTSKESGAGAGTGKVRVDMHVALHATKPNRRVLPPDDMRAKVLKTKVFNSFDTYFSFLTELYCSADVRLQTSGAHGAH
jgi:hypothetical protein